MNPRIAVLLMAYGAPESLEDVESYLADVRGGKPSSQQMLQNIKSHYGAIGGKSPLTEITRLQAQLLENYLNQNFPGMYKVFIGMRHWHPYIRDAVECITREDFSQVIALSMTPFESRMSTGLYNERLLVSFNSVASDSFLIKMNLKMVNSWFDHPTFQRICALNLLASLNQISQEDRQLSFVLFSAHSLPKSIIDQGDPYEKQFKQLCRQVAQLVGLSDCEWLPCYQSGGTAGIQWLGPSLEECITFAAQSGKKTCFVMPIGFVADNVEVLFDIDIELQQKTNTLGINLIRTTLPNSQSMFIQALAEIIHMEMNTK